MNISTSELLSYSNVLDNIIQSTSQVTAEMSRAIVDGICTKEEVEPIYERLLKSNEEAFEKHEEVTKEIDLRMKRDLRMKHGIRKVQSCITEFDTFIKKKTAENASDTSPLMEAVKNISEETIQNISKMEVIQDTDSD